jgi:hypothetical protein
MPTTRTWFGGTGQFNNANDWNPTGVPVSGDTAVIDTGTVKLGNQGLSGVTFELHGASEATQPVLALRNVALDDSIILQGSVLASSIFGEIDAAGVVTSAGRIFIQGGRAPEGHLTMDIRHGASFVNTGVIEDDDPNPGSLTVNGGTFVNNGTVFASASTPVLDTKIIGTGTFETNANILFPGGFDFGDSVSSGVTVLLISRIAGQFITIDKPLQFLAAIDGFGGSSANQIDLPNTVEAKVTSETFADNQLKLFEGHKLVADLNIVGDFTVGNFALSADQNGGTLIRFTQTPAMAATMPDPPIVPSMAHS